MTAGPQNSTRSARPRAGANSRPGHLGTPRKAVQKSVAAAVACELCPNITPEVGDTVLRSNRNAVGWEALRSGGDTKRQALTLAADPIWRYQALKWIADYHSVHRHGPTWRTFIRDAPWQDTPEPVRWAALGILVKAGDLRDARTPYGLQPTRVPKPPTTAGAAADETKPAGDDTPIEIDGGAERAQTRVCAR